MAINKEGTITGQEAFFRQSVLKGPIADKDQAQIDLDRLGGLYRTAYLPGKDRRRILNEYEHVVYGGTAEEQARGIDVLDNAVQGLSKYHHS